eukprot:s2500_g12.t2
MAIGIVLLSALLTPALAYYRTAIAIDGQVVKDAGNLTMGGKIGTYTVLLQVLNPPAGDLDLLLECCGEAQPLAGEASVAINSNTGGPTDNVRSTYKGEGKCTEPGLGDLLKQGNPKCSYLYSFKNKDWAKFSHTAVCVPEDVCSVNVAGMTDGRALTYEVVLQILNPSAGNLVYAGKGGIAACQEGMNQVNVANTSFFSKEEAKVADVFGVKIPIGKKSTVEIPGMKMMGPIELLGKCEDSPDTGVLYVFDNKFWDGTYQSMNVSGYYEKQERAREEKEIDELLNYGKDTKTPEKSEPEKSKPKLKAFDLAAALSDVAKGLKKKIEDSKGKDSAKAQKAIINQAEEKETKKLASQAEAAKETAKEPEAPPTGGYGPYGEAEPKDAEAGKEAAKPEGGYGPYGEAETTDVAAPAVPMAPPAPEAPKAPPAPEVAAPELPKAPPAPEAPKAPPAPEAPKAPPAPAVPKAPPAPEEKAAPKEDSQQHQGARRSACPR